MKSKIERAVRMGVTERVRRGYDSESARWQAVLRRDRGADGQFYYAVTTTGVYCRPSCGARRPRRENVQFHPTCAEAERAGFRPCRRCAPSNPDAAGRPCAAITAACRAIENSERTPSIAELASAAGMSRFHFHRVFTQLTGVTPAEYALAKKADRARAALRSERSVTEAIYAAGFQSNSRFYSRSRRLLGMKPRQYRSGGRGETIRFAVGECSLGSILVAASDKGVCAILLGDDPESLARELQDQFRHARLVGGDKEFERTIAAVVGFVEAPERGLDLPLDIRGTAFQQKVWNALGRIPPGTTVSYRELARRLGLPKSARAVGSACGANRLAVAIPCHRVVRADGAMSGYRWGIERKRALLKQEASARR